jgi:RNA polymerase sigma factor (sigma-70 family)|tara:strand:+ start:9433 stop:10479 length:1047 start_codon:yes stop_codon:yes gene_type:complete
MFYAIPQLKTNHTYLDVGKSRHCVNISELLNGEIWDYVDHPIFRRRKNTARSPARWNSRILEKALFQATIDMEDVDLSWRGFLGTSAWMTTSRRRAGERMADRVEDIAATKSTRSWIMTKEEEVLLFLQFNYARKIVAKQQRRHQKYRRSASRSGLGALSKKRLIRFYDIAMQARDKIAIANMGLLTSRAKACGCSPDRTFELVAEGGPALLRCIEKFDISRGYKFSTYAVNGINRLMWRYLKKVNKSGIVTAFSEDWNEPEDDSVTPFDAVALSELRDILSTNVADLTDREIYVIGERFPLSGSKQKTFEEIGSRLSVSKERVRQVQANALNKLRLLFVPETEVLDV